MKWNWIKGDVRLHQRVIKIIAWDKRDKEFRHDFLGKSGDGKGDWILFFQPGDIEGKLIDGINNPYPRERFDLLEFTGYNDKNKSEIYEGFILGAETHPALYLVKMESGSWILEGINGFKLKANLAEFADQYEIKGNCFETPELLKEGAQS